MKKRVKKWLDQFNIKLIILTHVHVDHSWNVKYIQDLYKCKVAIGTQDKKNIDNSKINSVAKNKLFNSWTKLMNWGMNKFIPEEYKIDYYLKNKPDLASGFTNYISNEIFEKYDVDINLEKIIYLDNWTSSEQKINVKKEKRKRKGGERFNRGFISLSRCSLY